MSYEYESDGALGGEYSNRLLGVSDGLESNAYISKDYKPNNSKTQDYKYDDNGNQIFNEDRRISKTIYNHLNLPSEITFSTGGKIKFIYNAEGSKIGQEIYSGSTLTKKTEYLGDMVFLNGTLDYIIHEEGRIVLEGQNLWPEFYVKDHLGNTRQVLRGAVSQTYIATMEGGRAATEEMQFTMLAETRQTESTHNVTKGGSQVAWLNAGRGRGIGPGRTQKIFSGDSIILQVHGKYVDKRKKKVNVSSFATQGGKENFLQEINEIALNGQRSGGGNPIALINLATIIAEDLQRKETPEAYLMYALYDKDSNRYEVGKKVLSRNALNQHEILEDNINVSKDGYLETFVVNETNDDVWFDNMMVMSVSSPIIQEIHYDPWGLELTGIGETYGGAKNNPFLFNGKEYVEDLNYMQYDFGARMYDPAIGRWSGPDPLAEKAPNLTPFRFGFNNPVSFTDPTGMFEYSDGYSHHLDSRNSTGSMAFQGQFEERTINTDLIVFSHRVTGEIYHSYTETYVASTGKVIGSNTLVNNPFLGNGFGDNGNFGQSSGRMQYASFGTGDFLTSGQLAVAALEPSFKAAAYEAFKGGGKGTVPFHLKRNIFRSYKAVNNNAVQLGKVNAVFATNGAAVLKVAAPALTFAAVGTNSYDILQDGSLTWGDAFVAGNTALQIAFPVYGVVYGAADVGAVLIFGQSISGYTKSYIDSNTSGSIKIF